MARKRRAAGGLAGDPAVVLLVTLLMALLVALLVEGRTARSSLASHRAHPVTTGRHLALFHVKKSNPVLPPAHTPSRRNLEEKGSLKTTGKYQQCLGSFPRNTACGNTSEQEHFFPVEGDEVLQGTWIDGS